MKRAFAVVVEKMMWMPAVALLWTAWALAPWSTLELRRHGLRAEGVVVDIQAENYRDEILFSPVVEYTTDRDQTLRFKVRHLSNPPLYRRGDRVGVLYTHQTQESPHVDRYWEWSDVGGIACLAAAGTVLILPTVLLWTRRLFRLARDVVREIGHAARGQKAPEAGSAQVEDDMPAARMLFIGVGFFLLMPAKFLLAGAAMSAGSPSNAPGPSEGRVAELIPDRIEGRIYYRPVFEYIAADGQIGYRQHNAASEIPEYRIGDRVPVANAASASATPSSDLDDELAFQSRAAWIMGALGGLLLLPFLIGLYWPLLVVGKKKR